MATRQVWLGNIPLNMTEGSIIQHFHELGIPPPWKALTRSGASGLCQYTVATFETVREAQVILGTRLCWPDGKHAIIRLALHMHVPIHLYL